MKKGWETKKLVDVATLQRGFDLPTQERSSGDVPLVTSSGISDTVSKSAVHGPGVATGRSGSIGNVFFIEEDFWPLNTVLYVKDFHGNDPRFVFHLLTNFDLKRFATGAGVPTLNRNFVHDELVNVPPLPQQQRIVGLLDEAFEGLATAKANAEKNLQNARALFESHLQSVLRSKKWKWKTLGDLCHDVEYGSSAKSKTEGGVPVLRMGNIQEGRLNWDNLVYTDDEAEIKKYLLKHNDVLFNRTNSPELVGKTAIYKSEMPAIFAGYLIRIHRNEDLLDGDFLTYFLNSQIAFDYGKTVVISSVNQANINGTKLKSYPIPVPSLSEQKAIVAKLDGLAEEVQHLARIYQQKLAALESLKKSLLHQAFSGAL